MTVDQNSPSAAASTPQLQEQIDQRRREIQTDGYPVSVGELVNLYRDGDLDIHPEFQRFFRWTAMQKSRFIESLLLGIPIPSIFVYQRDDGVWDVIDGLQRLSTILEFQGLLKDLEGNELPPSELVGTEYLPALSGRSWEPRPGQDGSGLSPEQQRLIKRAGIDVKIVRRESDEATKFDLFQRLNTGGSQLSDQEVRNSFLIMAGGTYYKWLLDLQKVPSFQGSIALSDRALAEQYDMELILRFLLLKDLTDEGLRGIGDLSDFLDSHSVEQARAFTDGADDLRSFTEVFDLIFEALEDSAFRRFDSVKDRFTGGFSVSAFESVTLGVLENLPAWRAFSPVDRPARLMALTAELWSKAEFRDNSGSGIRASTRLPKTVPFARTHFKP